MSGAGEPAPLHRETSAHTLRTGGLSLHAELLGSGPPLLVLHGFTGSCRSMEPVARGLAHEFQTVRIDLVGHGRSDAPREVAPYRMERCVDQLVGALDALEIGSAHVLGYSMGGRAALALCAWHPERVRSALLVGASAGIADPEERRQRRARDEALADRIESEGVEGFVDRWMAQPLFASQERLGREVLAGFREQRLANRAHGLAGSLRGMGSGAQPPLHDLLPRLTLPVRLVAGALDAKFAAIAEDLAGRLPAAAVELVPDAGHACHLEAREPFLAVARSFFTGAEMRRAESDASAPAAFAGDAACSR